MMMDVSKWNLLLCAEKLGFLGFGGSFGVVSPGEKLGDVLVLWTIRESISIR